MHSIMIDTNVDIDAPREAVWDVLVDFPSYGEWNPSMRIEGTLAVGKKLVVHLSRDGMTFRPEVLVATPNEELRWLGKLGFHGMLDGEHFFVLTTNGDGTTRLNHGERFSGALVAVAKGGTKNGNGGYEAFSLALKRRVEQLAQPG